MVQFKEAKGQVYHEVAAVRKIRERRATKALLQGDPKLVTMRKKKVKLFTAAPKWWTKASIKYAFSHPHVTSRLEKLMGSNLVLLTDREYMQKLQQRILEDYADSMDKRIRERENEEMERVKNLVLSGRIPLHEAPESMADHPIMLIEKHCRKLIAQRRAKIKIPKVHIPTHLYSDDTPDPPSGLSIENGHVFRKPFEKLCNPISRFLLPDELPYYLGEGDLAAEDEEAVEVEGDQEGEELQEPNVGDEEPIKEPEAVEEYMFTTEEYERLKYESPLVKMLRKCKTVEELYALADEIIGNLSYLNEMSSKTYDDVSLRSSAATSTLSSVKEAVSGKGTEGRLSIASAV